MGGKRKPVTRGVFSLPLPGEKSVTDTPSERNVGLVGHKPNHYYWDHLGNPFTCEEDHNHPRRTPDPNVVDPAGFRIDRAMKVREWMAEPEGVVPPPPTHYMGLDMQPWDVVKAFGLDFWEGNVLKYVLRAGRKGPAREDYIKARNYLTYLIERESDA